jgi:signal transduction histidine kinase
MVIVDPVGRDTGVTAAVVTISSTAQLRSDVLRRWLLFGLVGAVALLAAGLASLPVTRWILRPVRDLDEASAAISAGRLEARARELTGPPELRRMVASFNGMIDTVVRTLGRQRTFVADASHQLRNPLQALRLSVDNLAPYLTAEGREVHDDAVHEVEEMARILDSLLILTRLEAAATTPTPVHVSELISGHAPGWRTAAHAHGMTLRLAIPEDVWVLAPGDSLGHVLDELVGNAVRLSGGRTLRVTAESCPSDGVALHVCDDGTGLSDDERVHAVERFWRGRGQQNVSGTGLGLAICREAVAAGGGRLELRATNPSGLDVVLRLARATPVEDQGLAAR